MRYVKSGLQVNCAQLSMAGLKSTNEDSMGIRLPEGSALAHKGILAVVADGVSAAESGREASQTCVQNILYDYYCTPDTWSVQKSALAVLEALNRWLYSQGAHLADSERGFVTTLSAIIFKSTTAHIFHIGDSRIYRYKNNVLEQLTHDHARQVGKVRYLSRAMGLDSKIQVDYKSIAIEKGDQFILTTDGIHDFISVEQFNQILEAKDTLGNKIASLHSLALRNGSNDNLTAQIIEIEKIEEASQEEMLDRLTYLPFPPLLQAGQVIDELVIERVLYESNRSQLYVVSDQQTQVKYVMKTPSPNFVDDAAYISRFITESWIGKKIRHSKLVHIISPRVEPSCLYYLMEYVDGVTLDEWLQKMPSTSLDTIVRIARQIALGVRILHRHQVVHQDLKPSNIMIDSNEQIKLIDFGSCSLMASDEMPQHIIDDAALGTASYSAPECHLGKPLSYSADVFSLAAIIYEMLTGHLPFEGKLEKGIKEVDLAKLHYQPATKYNRYIPYWFDKALQKALSIYPENRYQDIDEFIYDLEHPNTQWLKQERKPLIEQNPLLVWQFIASVEMIIIVLLCFFMFK
jgi:serine/threonine protein phosphatase PrpC/tRNA A-37 threonylcarbamoyl transferase component Bud32